MIDSSHGTLGFSRQKRDEDGVPIPEDGGQVQRVVVTWPVPGYIARQMQTTEPPRPLPANHPARNDHAKTISRRTAVQFNGEWWDPGELVERLAENMVHQDPMEVRSDALPDLPDGHVLGNVRDVYGVRDRDD